MNTASSAKNADIEALRAIAVGLVLLCHLGGLLKHPDTLHSLLRFVDCWSGVDVFLCVSGFVIAGSLLRSGTPASFRELAVPFYIRRIFRIWPAAFLWLLIAVLAAKFTNTSGEFGNVRADVRDALAAVLQVHNVYVNLCGTGNLPACGREGIYWSLSLEEQFYMLFPLLLYLLGPGRLRWVLGALIVMQFPLARDAPDLLWYVRTDAIAYGVLIAIAADRGQFRTVDKLVSEWPRAARVLAVVLVVVVAFLSLTPKMRLDVALIALAAAGLVLLASCNRDVIVPHGRLRILVLWGGSRSFAIYLVHHPCYWGAREIFYHLNHGPGFANSFSLFATGTGLLVVAAEMSYRCVETPLRELGSRLAMRARAPSHVPVAVRVAQ